MKHEHFSGISKVEKLARVIGSRLINGHEVPLYMSNHYHKEHFESSEVDTIVPIPQVLDMVLEERLAPIYKLGYGEDGKLHITYPEPPEGAI